MSQEQGLLRVMEHTSISGKIHNCKTLEVHGHVDGEVTADQIIVQENGRLFGTIAAGDAEVHGEVQGEVRVRQLIKIGSTGAVSGNVEYGQMAIDPGGILSADVRNVPPELAGDLDVTVNRGQMVRITPLDLTAVDPDDSAQDLKFSVSNTKSGFIARAGATTNPLTNFTQAELQSGSIMFVHDGSLGTTASFDVFVADAEGATSGDPQTVTVNVR